MFKVNNLFSGQKGEAPEANSENVVSSINNWYSDRYNSIVVQRNLILIVLLLSLVLVIASVFVVGNVSSTFKIQPFVIEIEKKTGITNIVNPLVNRELTSDEVLNKYFITRYIKAREGYSSESWRYNYLTVVRLLSTPGVYRAFSRFFNGSAQSPIALYGNQTSTEVVFRSIQFFPPVADSRGRMGDSRAVVRFTIIADKGHLRNAVDNRIYKIVTLTYKYQQTKMSDNDRMENPLGFFITSYRDDIENTSIDVVK
ncbi:MAG: type IV secretion system protein [Rickettsiales bacterium]|nr:type IV secretion system protein [Rickettsiales bacterium]